MGGKLVLFVIGLLVIVAIGLFVFKNMVGDIRPAVLPPKSFPSQTNSVSNNQTDAHAVGETSEIPLQIPDGLKLGVFAKGLGSARDLGFSPGGVLLVSIPSAGRVLALPDKNNDGKADETKVVISGLGTPHGIAFYNGKLFIAERNKVSRYNWDENNLTASLDKKLFDLPNGGLHVTRSLVFDKEGKMYVSTGSSCNVCIESHPWLAAVVSSNSEGENPQLYSKGLRNAVFMTLNPETGQIWTTEMGRDNLGDDTPPEEVNILKQGGDFGWPYCYDNQVRDNTFQSGTNFNCGNTVSPVFKMQAHSAPLGLTFINSTQFPSEWQGDLLVSFHGSWNRSVPTGYKVVRLDVEGNSVKSQADFITGFTEGSQALGRPVDVIFDSKGTLFVSDDKAGVIYNLSKAN